MTATTNSTASIKSEAQMNDLINAATLANAYPLTTNVVVGDSILFKDEVYAGSFKKPIFAGTRWISGTVIKESYGEKTAQHTFTIEITGCVGVNADEVLSKKSLMRKGRNLYKECYEVGMADNKSAKVLDKNKRSADAKLNRDFQRNGL